MTDQQKWIRHRFEQPTEDYRPIVFPPPGPYWCTGEAGDGSYFIIVAYLPRFTKVTQYWPEARNIDSEERDKITYTDRFEKPDWFKL